MKLIFYTPRFFPLVGGLEKVARVWAEELTKMGEEITVITETAAMQADAFAFKVYRNIPVRRQWALMRQADAVVQFNVSLKGLHVCLLSGKPLIITHHTALFFPDGKVPWQQQLKRWVSDHLAKGNISCSRYIAAQFRQSAVVHSPYEAGLFVNKRLDRKPQSIIYVGRLVSDKGVDLLIDAVAALAGKFPALSLTIVGDGPDRQMLEDQALKAGVQHRVTFRGSLSGELLVDIMNRHELMVVPSRMEPFGTTVPEGLACGCRMIVSNQGGLPEAAGGLARLFETGDAGSLSAAIEEELQQPLTISDAALQIHLSEFSVESTARRFLGEICGQISPLIRAD